MSIRVLIADPDVSLLRTYQEHLSRNGFEVATAHNGLECVDRLRRFVPDVLVLEVDMPWGGGVGVLDMMYNGFELLPVPTMVLTARRDFTDFEEQLLFDSLCVYHVKPLAPEQLAGIIRRTLDDAPLPISCWELASTGQGRRRDVCATKPARDAAPMLCELPEEEEEFEPWPQRNN